MDDLEISLPTPWDENTHEPCPLCEYADDAGSAMGHLKQLDTALGGRTDDTQLGKMMEETYNTFFKELRQNYQLYPVFKLNTNKDDNSTIARNRTYTARILLLMSYRNYTP
jgi:hypothetical protein